MLPFLLKTSLESDHDHHEEHHEHGSASLIVKIVFVLLLPILSLVASLIPFIFSFCLKKKGVGKIVHCLLDIGQGFAAGILVGGAVLHIYPEVSYSMKNNIINLGGSERLSTYPFPSLIALSTFTLIYFSEFILGKLFEFVSTTKATKKGKIYHSHESHNALETHEVSDSKYSHKATGALKENINMNEEIELKIIPSGFQIQDIKTQGIENSKENLTKPIIASNSNSNSSSSSDFQNTFELDEEKINNLIEYSNDIKKIENVQNNDIEVKLNKIEDVGEMCLTHSTKHIHNHSNHHFDLLIDHHASVTQLITRGFILWLSLSIHSFLEGLGLGSQNDMQTIITLIVAILLHKVFEAYALGDVLRMGMKKKQVISAILLLLLYSITTTVGAAIGMGVSFVSNNWFGLVSNILLSVAIGALLHVGLFELLFHHTISESPIYVTIPYLLLYVVGILSVAILGIFSDHTTHNH